MSTFFQKMKGAAADAASKVSAGAHVAGEKMSKGAHFAGEKVGKGAHFVMEKTEKAVHDFNHGSASEKAKFRENAMGGGGDDDDEYEENGAAVSTAGPETESPKPTEKKGAFGIHVPDMGLKKKMSHMNMPKIPVPAGAKKPGDERANKEEFTATGNTGTYMKRDVNNHSDDVPTHGVSLACLRAMRDYLIDVDGADMSVRDVCDELIKPLTEGANTSFAGFLTKNNNFDMLKQFAESEDESEQALANFANKFTLTGEEAVGDATVYVSYTWTFKFVEVVEALEGICDPELCVEPLQAETTFFWFDIFVHNMAKSADLAMDWWFHGTFTKAVAGIGHTALVLLPWENPQPLCRAWVLWELLISAKKQVKFSIAMGRENRIEFNKRLKKNVAKIEGFFRESVQIDVEAAGVYIPDDKDKILQAMKKLNNGHLNDVSDAIKAMLIHWLHSENDLRNA